MLGKPLTLTKPANQTIKQLARAQLARQSVGRARAKLLAYVPIGPGQYQQGCRGILLDYGSAARRLAGLWRHRHRIRQSAQVERVMIAIRSLKSLPPTADCFSAK